MQFEYVPATDLRPGSTILMDDRSKVLITVVRQTEAGVVSLYREPTDAEYEAHLEEHGSDLRATWISTMVGWYHVLAEVPPQTGNLAY